MMRVTMKRIWMILGLLAVLLSAVPALAVDVPLDNSVYRFLERCDIQGYLDAPLSAVRPYSRMTVARLLHQVQAHGDALGAVEKDQLAYYRFEFSDELRREGDAEPVEYHPAWNVISRSRLFRALGLYSNDRDLVAVKRDDWGVFANYHGGYSVSHLGACEIGDEGGEQRVFNTGFESRAYWKGFSISGIATDSQVRGESVCFDTIRYPYRKFGGRNGANFDFYDTEASVAFQNRHILVQFGKNKNRWGYGETGDLTVNNVALPYTQLRAKFEFGPFELTVLQAKLMQQPPIVIREDTLSDGYIRQQFAEKFMAAHRLEIDFSRTFQVGLFEQVYYGERGFDTEYLHPLMFFRGAEHYNRDRDNMLLGFDLRLELFRRVSLYNEVLLDELKFDKLGSSYFTNKHAILIGAKYVDPFGLRNSLGYLEYARINPYVYTHKYPINTAQHYGVNMGYPLPPNSDAWTLGLRTTLRRGLDALVEVQRTRHGSNPADGRNVGGDARRPWMQGVSRHAPFLDGDLTTRSRIRAGVDAEVVYDLHLLVTLEQSWRHVSYDAGGNASDSGLGWSLAVSWHPVF